MGRRVLRYSLIGLFLLLLGGLWAFSFFFFSPFEGGYDYPIASLIPRDVDFYAAKAQLSRDFEPFPRLAFLDAVQAGAGGKGIQELGVRELVGRWKIEEGLKELESVLAQLPVHVDPLAIFGGEELAVAGNFAGVRLEDAQWAVYGRASWLRELAVGPGGPGGVHLKDPGPEGQPF